MKTLSALLNFRIILILIAPVTLAISGCSSESDADRKNRIENLLYTTSKNFHSKWIKIAESAHMTTYVHPELIYQDKKKDWIREATLMSDFKSSYKDAKNFKSMTMEALYDCRSWKIKYKRTNLNKSPMARSNLKSDIKRGTLYPNGDKWKYVSSSTVGAKVMAYTCKYSKAKKKITMM